MPRIKRMLLSLVLSALFAGSGFASWIPKFHQDFILKNVLPSTRGGIYPTDIVELQQIMKKHDIINTVRSYNVNLQLGRKSIAYGRYGLVPFTADHTTQFERYIVSIKNTLRRYPVSFFRQLRLTLYIVYDISGNIAGLACGREIILGSSSEQTLHHEIGHVVNNVFPELNNIWKSRFWANGKDPDRNKYVSGYAMTNYREDFAETFGSMMAFTHGKRYQYIAKYPNLHAVVLQKIKVIQNFMSQKEPVYTAQYWNMIMHGDLQSALSYRDRLVAGSGGNQPLSGRDLKSYYNNMLKSGIYAKDLSQVKQALDNGADPNLLIYSSYKWSALHYAAQYGNYQVVQLLLKRGADKSAKDSYGRTPAQLAQNKGFSSISSLLQSWTAGWASSSSSSAAASSSSSSVIQVNYNQALLSAAKQGDLAALRRALDNGASADYRGGAGWTPLLYMANKRNADGVKLLLDKGADVDYQGGRGWTALLIAAYYGDTAVARHLLNKGADRSLKSGRGETALQLARRRGHTALAALLDDSGKGSGGGDTGDGGGAVDWNNRLLKAAQGSDLAAVRQALDKGADINTATAYGWTPLMLAVYKNNSEMVRYLLGKGADRSRANKGGYTALRLAQYYKYAALVQLLDGSSGSGSATGTMDWDMELLKAAYRNDYSRIVKAVNSGAKVNAAAKSSGWRAVHYLAFHGNLQAIQYLAGKGAELEARTVNQMTPLAIAQQYGHEQLRRWLSDRITGNSAGGDDAYEGDGTGDSSSSKAGTGSVDLQLLTAAYRNDYDAAARALRSGANVNAPARNSLWRAVHYAAYHGNTRMLQLLQSNGADLQARTADGLTAYAVAARYNRRAAASWLRSRD